MGVEKDAGGRAHPGFRQQRSAIREVNHLVTGIAQRPRQRVARSSVVVDHIYFTPDRRRIPRHVPNPAKNTGSRRSDCGDCP
jgi:hypothetical protein